MIDESPRKNPPKITVSLGDAILVFKNTTTFPEALEKLIGVIKILSLNEKLNFLRFGVYVNEDAPEPKFQLKGTSENCVEINLHQDKQNNLANALKATLLSLHALEEGEKLLTQNEIFFNHL